MLISASAPRSRSPSSPRSPSPSPSRYLGTERTEGRAGFLPYIHGFRAVAIVGVVASHLDLAWPDDSFTGRLVLELSQNSSAMFLFVAGFLFQHLSRGFTYRRYLKSKLLNVVVPYVVVSLPALFYQYWHRIGVYGPHGAGYFSNPFARGAAALVVAEQMPAPMWFIPMIAVLYLAAPLLIAVDRRPRLYWLLPPLLLVAMLCHRPLPVNRIGQALIYFTPAYLAGMWFSHYRQRIMRFVDDHLIGIWIAFGAIEVVSLFVLKRGGVLFSHRPFSFEGGLLDLNLPSKLVLSFGLIGLLARYQAEIGGKLDYLAGASFGVFFVHEYAIEISQLMMARFGHRQIEASVVNVAVLIPLYTGTSLAVVALLRAVAGKRSRYLVGC